MAPLTNDEIEDGLRDLVRAEYLVGWYSWMWTEGRHWTLRPAHGGCVTYRRDDVTAYLQIAAVVI
jgi:hypothetical protein